MATINHNHVFLVRTAADGGHTYTIRSEKGFLVTPVACAHRFLDARTRESPMNTRLPMNRKLLTVILVGLSAAFMAACGGSNSNT